MAKDNVSGERIDALLTQLGCVPIDPAFRGIVSRWLNADWPDSRPPPASPPSSNSLFSDRFSIACCMGQSADGCACGFTEERALRAVIDGRRSMTPDERAWCSDQIASVEGHEAPPADWSDVDVARGVLSAWMDYCRDKGML
jgi:hypothetical protein